MEGINYLGLVADILAIISLLLAMYFYYGSRTKEIDELKKIVQLSNQEQYVTWMGSKYENEKYKIYFRLLMFTGYRRKLHG